ncbi:hypothetical protein EVAR_79071_1 [Eumeta japonica]|uniref:Mariner Mos1 transposase n=1 Tax=Eumeta variegata TaxID=151549 RepID=A0A4C1ZP70_EUMVA|nr:hypothetical protein EVAR_79071_1 [Eumeta japonica]
MQNLRQGRLTEPEREVDSSQKFCYVSDGITIVYVYCQMIPDVRTITAEIYDEQLIRMYEVLSRKYPGLAYRNRVLLRHGDAGPHTLRKLRGIRSRNLMVLKPHHIQHLVRTLHCQTAIFRVPYPKGKKRDHITKTPLSVRLSPGCIS